MFVYSLHHAADDTIPLLIEARRVAKRYITILEDIKADTENSLRGQRHHGGCKPKQGCIFRSEREWEDIFKREGLNVVEKLDAGRNCMSGYVIPRAFYVLEVNA